jgi:TPP-dependent pyruvate/acetoin dehydrogenase alpha subunit
MLGNQGVVGSGIPHAVGAAFSAQYRGTSQVAVSFFGDGAANVGSFHEGLNLASIWKLPIVFVCENNLYGLETPFQRATAGQDIAARAGNYALPGFQVDGQDVLAVYEAAGAAIDRACLRRRPDLSSAPTATTVIRGRPGAATARPRRSRWRRRDHSCFGIASWSMVLRRGSDQVEREVEALSRRRRFC